SEFTTRTSAGGPVAEILSSPVVNVVSAAMPGDVVVNELLPTVPQFSDGDEGAEFIELYNTAGTDLVIDGWTLSDMGRTGSCATDARWAFPAGTIIPADGYVVVCRNAERPGATPRGFLPQFPGFPGVPLFEVFDAASPRADSDHAGTPNMILLTPTSGDDQFALLGGPVTNGGQCVSDLLPSASPYAEAIVLRNALGEVIDAVRYRNPGPCDGDFCEAGSFGDAAPYAFGAPKWFHSLGRDAGSADLDDSSRDLRPATVPTPGATNQPGDTVPPAVEESRVSSGTVLDILFDEIVDDASATDPAHYTVTVNGTAAPVAVREVIADHLDLYRHYVLVTDPLPGASTGTLSIDGVTDLAFDGGTPNVLTGSVSFAVPVDALPICEVQSFDNRGFSPYDGEEVTVAGFVTIAPAAADRISIWVQEPGEGGCGVNVFSFDYPADALTYGVRLNDLVQVHGRVTEFVSSSSGSGAVTELSAVENAPFYSLIARGAPGPEPRVVRTRDANDETLEGTLVRTRGTVINANSLAAYIDDGSGSIQVFQNFSSLDLTRYTVGDHLEVTGIITQFDSTEPFFSGYELVPQSQDALVLLDGGFADGGPLVEANAAVLVPSLGEAMRITVRTPRRSDVIVEIYDVTGRKVHTLYDGVGLGMMEFDWDGLGQDGALVPPGAYMCHVRAVALDGGSVVTKTVPVIVGMRLE
ncbi:lamin tail domain-containing protein, partial [bacterium]|nr:lamin tail domain-containing protein [bacterium]